MNLSATRSDRTQNRYSAAGTEANIFEAHSNTLVTTDRPPLAEDYRNATVPWAAEKEMGAGRGIGF